MGQLDIFLPGDRDHHVHAVASFYRGDFDRCVDLFCRSQWSEADQNERCRNDLVGGRILDRERSLYA